MEGYSNKDYKRLGDRIRSNPKEVADADLLMLQELSWFKSDKIATNSRLMRTEWTNSINSAIDVMLHMRWKMKHELTFNPLHIIPYMHKQRMRKHFIWRITERVPMAAEFL